MAVAKRAALASVGSIGLAILATQHHNLHMLILAAGAGSAGMSFMTLYPTLRRAMLLMSVAVTVVMIVGLWRARASRKAWVTSGLTIALTVVLVAWSVVQSGL